MRFLVWIGSACWLAVFYGQAGLKPERLRTEYLANPAGLDEIRPRLSWIVASDERDQRQSARQILVASSPDKLAAREGDLWDSGRVESGETVNIEYGGQPLTSRQRCFWAVRVWDRAGRASEWSPTASWSMGLLSPSDWKGEWISHRDDQPLHQSRDTLFLPPARHYRKGFTAARPVKRATVYAAALGLVELHLNGQRIGDAWFEPGWSDYHRRAYYRTHDVTGQVRRGENCLGAIVAEGWYAGYVGYGLLVGYGPNRAGRYFYGKTPALLVQLELEYEDGSRDIVATDPTWQVSADGPIREADLIMGEAFDARQEDPHWCRPAETRVGARGPDRPWRWENAIRAADNGSTRAIFSDNCGDREVELGFRKPPRLQAYAAPPIRVTEELKARRLTEPAPGVYVFDFGQNFAGNVRLHVKGEAGTRLRLRFGEMLHPDGRLMTENLRRARATDFYTLRGDPDGETWTPRFTYHGFQFVEITGLPGRPTLDTVTGLVLHNDTPLTGEFACSDEVMSRFWKNTVWTQRANFIEIPTDCPQRDERLGWMGDAQIYIRTATFNADVAAFFTKWLDDVEEAQRDFGAYPDYCPYPMGHGAPGQTWGTAWTDAGIICPHTIWQVYGDRRVIERHWNSMTRFMEWRKQRAPDLRGKADGNTWGDWLNLNEPTPIELIDAAYFTQDARLMSEMARAIGRDTEAAAYADLHARLAAQFAQDYLGADGTLSVGTQTAHVLALRLAEAPATTRSGLAAALAERIAKNDVRMATGFLGTKHLLPALSEGGYDDLAARLFQSRRFPSWGYEVINGATTVWERWDSFTTEHGFNGAAGDQNASMNSFSHYAFGAVMEWAFRTLAGMDTDGPGFARIRIAPRPPAPDSSLEVPPIHWVRARYDSIRGPIATAWKRTGNQFELEVTVPANTSATVIVPARSAALVRENGQPLAGAPGVKRVQEEPGRVVLAVASGTYRFSSEL
ncbi:MAG: family 78 glycoside hydrolase catalytic domain [Verrucomicrobia bacterium]|nr:family 78 glycoside hydrolase catalytic domain [Verrucomicrobiota bacterium]